MVPLLQRTVSQVLFGYLLTETNLVIMAKAKRAAKASAPKAKKTVKKSTKKAAPKKK